MYIGKREQYGLIRGRVGESRLLLKVKQPSWSSNGLQLYPVKSMEGHEEIEAEIEAEEVVVSRLVKTEDQRRLEASSPCQRHLRQDKAN